MSDKKAFVFDTNFIIQTPELNEVIDNLKAGFTVYVTQVSIDERIGQQCRELKKKYDDIPSLTKKYKGIMNFSKPNPYEKCAEVLRKSIQQNYEKAFGDNILPFKTDEETFKIVLKRANLKLPPFIESTSDKGFKDALIWISMLDFFESKGENDVVFVTNDNGFRNNEKVLCEEFKEKTGKNLSIKSNEYYKELIKKEPEKTIITCKEKLPDVSHLRNRIENVVIDLCGEEICDYFGNTNWVPTFSFSQKADESFVKAVFGDLQNNIQSHIFELSVPATTILGCDERIQDGDAQISLKNLETALKLLEEIKRDYPEYEEQFYTAATNIMNRNYVKPIFREIPEEELPF